jgi:hypothetical protein
VIRRCLENARAIVGEERPFSTHRFRTDGRSVFLESLREALPAGSAEDGSAVIDLKTNQLVFKQVVERTFKDLDIEQGLVVRWRPYGGKPSIVIDPARSFGKPLAADFGARASRGGRGVCQARGEAVRGSRISRQRRGQLRAITDGRVRVIFDENLSPALARALNALFAGEHEVAHIRDKFGPKVDDADWISALSAEGRWVVVSGDAKIARRKSEQAALPKLAADRLLLRSRIEQGEGDKANAEVACPLG